MNDTDQQKTFITQVEQFKKQAYILQALAGTGKTTTLLKACPPEPTLALAFNKRIKEELEERFPKNADSKTFNGLGHGVWTKQAGKLRLSEKKIYGICRRICEDIDENWLWKQMGDLMQLVNSARASGLVHASFPDRLPCIPLIEDIPDNWYALCDSLDVDERLIQHARNALLQSTNEGLRGSIDFQDQLYLPVVFRGPFPRGKYKHLIVDEAQDLGPLEHEMVRLTLGKSGRLIAAGDHHQAIYGWRGAHADSMHRLSEMTAAKELPLTITFRCPKAIVREANIIVPEYEAAPSAPDGSVARWGKDWLPSDIPRGPTTAILCRNNKPLFILAMQMIRQKISCRMEGRDVGVGIKRVIQNVIGDETMSSKELIARIDDWRQQQLEKFLAKGDQAKAAKAEDQAESIIAVAMGCGDSAAVIATIDELFGRNSRGIVLSTIHKAKGLEWQDVFILDKHLIGKYARAEWAMEQENNLLYVAITRAMSTLTFMESPE